MMRVDIQPTLGLIVDMISDDRGNLMVAAVLPDEAMIALALNTN